MLNFQNLLLFHHIKSENKTKTKNVAARVNVALNVFALLILSYTQSR